MSSICENCINFQICIENDISPQECENIDFNNSDFENILSKKKWGEYYWQEVSYRKYTEDSLDYGDLSDLEEEDEDL